MQPQAVQPLSNQEARNPLADLAPVRRHNAKGLADFYSSALRLSLMQYGRGRVLGVQCDGDSPNDGVKFSLKLVLFNPPAIPPC